MGMGPLDLHQNELEFWVGLEQPGTLDKVFLMVVAIE